ncbi:MAG: uncharacterized protein JWL62_718 [Hyphomicrobiales bacterium]|nr:uncharacterized protein [Hyphomicrobiales bacterium]
MRNAFSRTRLTSVAIGAFIATSMLIGADAGAAVDLSAPAKAAGPWDMSLNDTNRKCRFQLRAADDAQAQNLPLAMPAGCKRALPILADVGRWSLGADRTLRLDDAEGTPVLEFKPSAGSDELQATGPEGEIYQLISEQDAVRREAGQQVAQAPGGFVEQAPVGTGFSPKREMPRTAAPQNAVREQPAKALASREAPATSRVGVAGRYAPLREARDTGCMLTLDDKTRGPKGTNKAQLAPACRDQGLVIFDPVGWQLEHGRLALTARKGHIAHFERQGDGVWVRDAKEGKALSLRPM